MLSPEEELAGGWQGGRGGQGRLGGGAGVWVSVFVLLIDLHEPSFHAQFLLFFKATVCINNSVATAYTSLPLMRGSFSTAQ